MRSSVLISDVESEVECESDAFFSQSLLYKLD